MTGAFSCMDIIFQQKVKQTNQKLEANMRLAEDLGFCSLEYGRSQVYNPSPRIPMLGFASPVSEGSSLL
jgi:hypothetical protein